MRRARTQQSLTPALAVPARPAAAPGWAALLLLWPAVTLGQEGTGLCRRHHPWGGFEPGAWKLVRVVTETLNPDGTLTGTSTTDTRTVLIESDPEIFTLRQSVTVEVAGKRFEAEPKTVAQGFCGQRPGQSIRFSAPKSAEVVVEGRPISCRVQQMMISGPSTKKVTKVYFHDKIQPHVLKRETVITEPGGHESVSESTTEVVALNMPFQALTEVQTTAHLRTVHKHPKGTVVTTAVHSPEVPGGVVAHWSKELDQQGNVVRRSTLELVDYGLKSQPLRRGLFGRRRKRLLRPAE